MINFPGKKVVVKIYNRIKKENDKIRAKKTFPNLDNYIFELYFQSFGISAPLSLLYVLDNLLMAWKPLLTVEFGSGVSTVVLAKNLQNTNSKIITFDEDTFYLEKTRQNIIKKYKADNIEFIPPLKEGEINYRVFKRKELSSERESRLVIIDGPTDERFTNEAKQIYEK